MSILRPSVMVLAKSLTPFESGAGSCLIPLSLTVCRQRDRQAPGLPTHVCRLSPAAFCPAMIPVNVRRRFGGLTAVGSFGCLLFCSGIFPVGCWTMLRLGPRLYPSPWGHTAQAHSLGTGRRQTGRVCVTFMNRYLPRDLSVYLVCLFSIWSVGNLS